MRVDEAALGSEQSRTSGCSRDHAETRSRSARRDDTEHTWREGERAQLVSYARKSAS